MKKKKQKTPSKGTTRNFEDDDSGHWRMKTELAIIIFNHIQLTSKVSIFFLRKKKKSQFGVTALSDHCAIKIKWVYLMFNRDSLKGGLVTTIVSLKNEWAEFPLTWKCDFKSVGKQQAKGCVHVKIESTISALVPWKVCWARIRLKIYIYTPTWRHSPFPKCFI